MKRITAWLLVLAVILCGCGQETAQLSPAVTLTVAVQEGLSSEAMAGLERFCQKIDALSDGEMTIQLVPSPDVLDSLDQGCNLIFASNDEIARADSNFLSYTSPFYFYDYTHLSQTLNSQAFRDLIAEGTLSLLGALPLAAFYDGNSVILSSGPLSFDTADQLEGADLTISNDPILSDLLRGFGARVRIREEESKRLEGFCSGSDPAIECRITSLSALTPLPEGDRFTICQTFHRARINWIMLSEASRETLTEKQQAVLIEAAAYALAYNDQLVLSAEERALEAAQALGGDQTSVIFGEFLEPVQEILQGIERYNSIWNWEQHLEVQQLSIQNEH